MPLNFKNKKEIYAIAVTEANEYTDKKYQHTQTVIYAILVVVVLVFVQIVVDSFRFNGMLYKDYGNRLEERNILLSENKELLQDIMHNLESVTLELKQLTKNPKNF